jgi:RNA polymerase sigma-70 factor (ECF subfamily)
VLNAPAASDAELAARWLDRRDDAAFQLLFARHAPAMLALLIRLSEGEVDEAEDTLQEAWVRASARLDEFEWRSSLRTWLTGIAINLWRERRRSRTTHDRIVGAIAPEGPTPPWRPETLDLERAIAALPPGYREVLILHDVNGHTHEEIGEMLGVAAGTSKSQLARARAALRARLGEGEGGLRDARA